jgi:hypothetical protein
MRRFNTDVVAGLVAVAVGTVAFTYAGEWERATWRFPIAVSIVLLALGVGLLLKGLFLVATKPEAATPAVPGLPPEQLRLQVFDVTVVSVSSVAYLWLLGRMGFLVTALVIVSFLMAFLSREQLTKTWWKVPLVSGGIISTLYYLFGGVLNVPFQSGRWWQGLFG